MKKSEQKSLVNKKHKSIKNVYIHKINSLKKLMGGPNFSMPCLCTSRKNLLLESQDDLTLKRRENNKDAAKKARLRKKLYMELLEETIAHFRQLDEEGKILEKSSEQLLHNLTIPIQCKQEDEIGQYLLPSQTDMAADKVRKDLSQMTMDAEKGCDFNKILVQIEMSSFPQHMVASRLRNASRNIETARIIDRMQQVQQQLPEIFMDLKNISSDHTSLLVLSCSSKPEGNVDPYFGKTLMEEYYSKTLCRKDAVGIETHKSLNFMARMETLIARSQQIGQSDFMQDQ